MVVIFLGSSLLLVNISIVFALCIAVCAIDLKDIFRLLALTFQLVDVHRGLTNLCVTLEPVWHPLPPHASLYKKER